MNQMSVATFDTLAAVRNLEKAGMGTMLGLFTALDRLFLN